MPSSRRFIDLPAVPVTRRGQQRRVLPAFGSSGSTSVTLDASGNKIDEMKYYPFGETRSGSTPTDRRFTGQRAETGLGSLYDYNARMYSPVLGRFLSADSIVPNEKNPQAWNRYAYTVNNPLKYQDPSGHYMTPWDNGGGGFLGYGGGGGWGGGSAVDLAWSLLEKGASTFVPGVRYLVGGRDMLVGIQNDDILGTLQASLGLQSTIVHGGLNGLDPSLASGEAQEAPQSGSANDIGIKISDYAPSDSTGFSGVYDPQSGKILLRPSGQTLLANGEVPSGRVDQFGGHSDVNAQMGELFSVNTHKTVGFYVLYNNENEMVVGWNSGQVNLPNYGNPAAPVEFRQPIMDLLQKVTEFNVKSR